MTRKKFWSGLLTAVFVCSVALSGCGEAQAASIQTVEADHAAAISSAQTTLITAKAKTAATKTTKKKTPFQKYGALKVKGAYLRTKSGKKCQLRGVSTHGIAWYPEYVNKAAFKTLRDKWGVNTIRLAMYTSEYNGYCNSGAKNRQAQRKRVYKGIDAATDLGMYVIVDWHILSDGNPNKYVKKAKDFFNKVSKKYKKQDNIIYEICNEPNGNVTWSQIKKYANKVIPVIRKNDPNAIIIVGTPTWSQDVDKAAASPLKYKNVMYSLHFYAGTHKKDLRSKMYKAYKKGLPMFVTEFSICDASGNGKLNKTQGNKWLNSLDKKKISYVAWNLSNKNESSALLKPSCKKTSGWTTSNLSASGKWYLAKVKAKEKK